MLDAAFVSAQLDSLARFDLPDSDRRVLTGRGQARAVGRDRQTANPADVKRIEVSLTVQSTIPYDNAYSEAAWEKKISPRNL